MGEKDSESPAQDLAQIVLGVSSRGRKSAAPERVPIDSKSAGGFSGYDLRSVGVLALVVAVLAGLIGWSTTIGDSKLPSADNSKPSSVSEADQVASKSVAEPSESKQRSTVQAAFFPDFQIGRIAANRAANGSGIVTVGVNNVGSKANSAKSTATVQLIVDNEVVGTEPIPVIQPNESSRVAFSLAYCPVGAVNITAIIDANAVVREADERNNATSRVADFGC